MLLFATAFGLLLTADPAPPGPSVTDVETATADPVIPQRFLASRPVVPGATAEVITLMAPPRERDLVGLIGLSGSLPGGWAYTASADQFETAYGRAAVINDATVQPSSRHPLASNPAHVWQIRCRSDAMTDERLCFSYIETSPVTFWTDTTGNLKMVCVFRHDFPGRSAQYRLDSTPAQVLAPGVQCIESLRALAAVRSANSILFRFYTWPRDIGVLHTVELAGLSSALTVQRTVQRGDYRLLGTRLNPPVTYPPPPPAPPAPAPGAVKPRPT